MDDKDIKNNTINDSVQQGDMFDKLIVNCTVINLDEN
eukprot:CAMPEP_0116945064 /NCGR_PEP_ID=MMETSP0467-20121206/36146_1 /TAXON_ID=283647 /ORGANISM="Mesodinium pulex, Strain SPMC105" /LENGTH=36 /DNA_ID= /DNA_START= /DNA_END= /DNA_ORIENTATION=